MLCVTCDEAIPDGHVFVDEGKTYCALHAPRGSRRWTANQPPPPSRPAAEFAPIAQSIRPVSGSAEDAVPVRLVMTFDDAFRITWLFMLASLVLGLIIGIILLVLLVAWRMVTGF